MRILIDIDGVLCNFIDGYLSVANRLASTEYKHDDVKAWDMDDLEGLQNYKGLIWQEIKQAGFARALQPYPGATDGIKRLQKFGEVYFVTSPIHSPTWQYDRTEWVQEHFGISYKKIHFCYDKNLVHGDVFVDDKPENCKNWIHESVNQGGMCFLWDRLYNQSTGALSPSHLITRTNSWDDLISFIDPANTTT